MTTSQIQYQADSDGARRADAVSLCVLPLLRAITD